MPKEWSKGLRPPEEVLLCDDVRDLLVWTSDLSDASASRRHWACAVLRVMHTIAHIEGSYRFINIEHSAKEIMARFEPFIFRSPHGNLRFGTPEDFIELHALDWKQRKSRTSVILKLLHKRANVAETIYDMVGLRVVTKNLSDTLLFIKYLRDLNIVSYPNCVPSRARNTLLDVDDFRQSLDDLRGRLLSKKISAVEFEKLLQQMKINIPQNTATADNPHSSAFYRAIQFTCRQMVSASFMGLSWIEQLENFAAKAPKEHDAAKVLAHRLLAILDQTEGFQDIVHGKLFFPFEIQVMDAKAYTDNRSGSASHTRYKKSQVTAARRRVLSGVLNLND